MTALEVLAILQGSAKFVEQIYNFYKQIVGDKPIPTLAEILVNNSLTEQLIAEEEARLAALKQNHSV